MQGSFEIRVDQVSGIIEAKVFDFWDLETVDEFRRQRIAAQEGIKRAGKTPLLLIDARQQWVQAREVVNSLQNLATGAKGGAIRTAVLVESAARSWLLSEE